MKTKTKQQWAEEAKLWKEKYEQKDKELCNLKADVSDCRYNCELTLDEWQSQFIPVIEGY